MKKTLLTILTIVLTVAIGAQVANAIGSLTPSGTAGDATQYTLNDIYTKLTTNTSTSTKSGMFTTPGSVTATFRTLTEIYDAIPTIDATKVATGTSYLGVMGTKQDGVVYPTQWSTEDPTGYVTWQAAMDYCDYLETDGSTVNVAVQNIWRLPTYIELVNAYLTGVSGFQSDYYWSSTEVPGSPSNAYFVYMDYGNAYYVGKTNPGTLARCTR